MDKLSNILLSYRFDLGYEPSLQNEIARVLSSHGVDFVREAVLGPKSRIDFLVEDIGIEVKVGGGRGAIIKQVIRYCASPMVGGIILATGRTVGLPGTINGKHCVEIRLGMALL